MNCENCGVITWACKCFDVPSSPSPEPGRYYRFMTESNGEARDLEVALVLEAVGQSEDKNEDLGPKGPCGEGSRSGDPPDTVRCWERRHRPIVHDSEDGEEVVVVNHRQ